MSFFLIMTRRDAACRVSQLAFSLTPFGSEVSFSSTAASRQQPWMFPDVKDAHAASLQPFLTTAAVCGNGFEGIRVALL